MAISPIVLPPPPGPPGSWLGRRLARGPLALIGAALLAGIGTAGSVNAQTRDNGSCISGEKYVSVNGMAGPFVRNSVTSNNPVANAENPLVANVPGTNNIPADNVNIPTAYFGGPKVFYRFVIRNCGTVPLYKVRLDDCIDQRSVGDTGFLQGGANGNCVDPRAIPFNPQRIVAETLAPGATVTVDSASPLFATDPIATVDICEAYGRNRVDGIVRNDSEVEANIDSNPVFGGPTFVFFDDLNLVRCKEPGVKIVKFTNGHDGDNANGVPTSGDGGFSIGTNSVAQIAPNAAVSWTYRVANTGNEPLNNVAVTDNRLGSVICPKTTLAIGEVMDCTASGFAQGLVAGSANTVQGCGSGGVNTRPTYANRGTVNARGSLSNAMLTDFNDSHYCNPPPPACNLALTKTCEVVQAPTPDWADCKGKLQQFSMIWPSNRGTINISGIANNAPGGVVNPGQRVTFSGPFSQNDQVLNISGAVNGQSVFHVSCSDKDMDGETASNDMQPQLPGKVQDCGKFEGNGKGNGGGFVNAWLLDGLTDADGKVLNCSPAPVQTSNACSFQMQDPPACGSGQDFKPETLTFKYTGGGCGVQSNGQEPGKTSCSGQINPSLPVNVAFSGGSATVAPGGSFTMPRKDDIVLSNSGGTQTIKIHTSCSQPLAVGDVYFSLTLVGQDGRGLGRDVKYSYLVSNTGSTTATGISVVDDKLGAIGSIASLAGGASQTLTKTAPISETTTNVATATSAASCPAPGVTSTATVTVLPPPPCTIDQEFYKVEDDKYKLKLTNTGNKVVTLDRLVLNWPANATYGSIKEVKLDGTAYKADKSNLVVTSGVPITPDKWTESDVSKRQIDPGKEETLEIVFKEKWKKENCVDGKCFAGTASFAQGCSVSLGQMIAQ